MALFKRKKDTELLPELPGDDGLPALPDMDEWSNIPELPPLDASNSDFSDTQDLDSDSQDFSSDTPSYPPLRKPQGASQNEIKRILSSNEVQRSPYGISTREALNEQSEPIIAEPTEMMEEIPEPTPYKKSKSKNVSSEKEAIYIRLDKFQVTKQALNEIKDKIEEISETLSKVKGIKEREEKELEEWEREMMLMKNKIDSIDSKLFDNII